ncbi:putative mitochondrial carrier C688,09 [Talaromyces islandicus]|uniref:Putative mitochondrial carrier C688,09 n=1 Tax=Talaromyces islandicus TaxID=28573 RepID=A0A0U1LP36_TALIS|nr:putative mitochondrial carrier C688,09 [Talaromyces islandicus]
MESEHKRGVRIKPMGNTHQETEQRVTFLKSFSHLLAGATAGMVTAVVTSPLDVLKTRLQSDFYQSQLKKANPSLPLYKSSLLHFRETFGILFSIHRLEGWRGLFKGLGPSLTGVVPATGIKFYAYGNCKTLFPQILGCEEDTTLVHALSAASAGIVTGTATNPIWLVKTRLQLDKSRMRESGSLGVPQYRNSLDCVKQVIRQEGVKGLYRGLAASYLGVIETTLHLAMYERMKGFLAKQNENAVNQDGKRLNKTTQGIALSGAAGFSKLLAVLIAYPHEVVRTRLRQAPMANGRLKYTGVVQCLRLVWREEGMVAIYGGLTAHLLRTVPAAMITLGTYELVLKLLSWPS